MDSKKMDKSTKAIIIAGIAVVLVMIAIIGVVISKKVTKTVNSQKTLAELMEKVHPVEATPTKGQISFDENNLYDELPEITKYPTSVDGTGYYDIEIFTSGEKAGKDTDSWLITCAKNFNAKGVTASDGNTVSITVRSVSSGLASDYIASGKYLPDLYTPSNTLFGDYCTIRGGSLTLYNERLVGNTAGILVKKNSGYTDIESVINDVIAGKINIGYTNPQTSATGLNLLIEILNQNGGIGNDTATDKFTEFNNNIPYVAYTTQQMRDSASNGKLDGMVSEYQAYINDNNLTSVYDFIPFGTRHDNPLYVVDEVSKTSMEMEAIDLINDYLISAEAQTIATQDGFNAFDDFKSEFTATGAEVSNALDIYKSNKDGGKDIIAVFVADSSGSMDGAPMQQLKQSLSNGASYINDNNKIGLVSYATAVTIELPIAEFDLNQRAYFQGAINHLYASGSTSTYNAILVAMTMIEEEKAKNPDAKCMIILLSDGYANEGYGLDEVTHVISESQIPIYTISYGSDADTDELAKVSNINEAASINADSDDIVYKIKSLFNSQL